MGRRPPRAGPQLHDRQGARPLGGQLGQRPAGQGAVVTGHRRVAIQGLGRLQRAVGKEQGQRVLPAREHLGQLAAAAGQQLQLGPHGRVAPQGPPPAADQAPRVLGQAPPAGPDPRLFGQPALFDQHRQQPRQQPPVTRNQFQRPLDLLPGATLARPLKQPAAGEGGRHKAGRQPGQGPAPPGQLGQPRLQLPPGRRFDLPPTPRSAGRRPAAGPAPRQAPRPRASSRGRSGRSPACGSSSDKASPKAAAPAWCEMANSPCDSMNDR